MPFIYQTTIQTVRLSFLSKTMAPCVVLELVLTSIVRFDPHHLKLVLTSFVNFRFTSLEAGFNQFC